MIRLLKKLAVFLIILVGILLLGGIATAGYFAFTYREPINNYYKEGYNKISEYNTEIKKISQNIFQNNLVKTLSEVEKSLNEGRKLTQNNSFASGLDSSLNALEGSLKKINNFDSNAAFTQIKHTLNNITSFVDQMLEKFPNPFLYRNLNYWGIFCFWFFINFIYKESLWSESITFQSTTATKKALSFTFKRWRSVWCGVW